MHVNTLTLTDFRNYRNARLELSPFTNLIYGNNAQGKTNLLEAVYLFAQGRSHRARSDKELIRFGAEAAALEIAFEDSDRKHSAKMRIKRERAGKKAIWINSVPISKLSGLMRYLNVVMFSPEDLELVKGAPSFRRKFIDSALSQLYPNYLVNLSEYGKALMQKNSLLKQLHGRGIKTDAMLTVWNMSLAGSGAAIMRYRRGFAEYIGKYAAEIQEDICGEGLSVEYAPSIRGDDISEEMFLNALEARQEHEIEYMSSLAGIQRDDLKITINGREARLFGSQGQQRTAALAVKIAQAEYIRHVRDEYPVLLLDDIMSELDINRRSYLSQRIKDKQVLITATDTDIVKSTEKTKLFHISGGTIEE